MFSSAALLLAFSPAFCARAFGQDTKAAAPSANSTAELDRLVEISTRLATLNERLRSELADSKRNSSELAALLESSRLGLEALRSELETSRRISTGLSELAESSARESTALREALTRAEDSLRSSEASFEDFRRAAEARIRKASLEKLALGLAAVSGWALAIGFLLFGG